MPTPNQNAVVETLADFIALGREVKLPKVVQPLERFESEFRTAKPTFKVLRSAVKPLLDKAFLALRDRLCDLDHEPRPGMKKQVARMEQTFRALDDLIYPPPEADATERDIVGLAGNEESTTVLGDVETARIIAKKSLEVVREFSATVFKQDVEAAYALCANELRTSRSIRQFVTGLQDADARYGGPAVDLNVERITWIYADEASRERSNRNGQWPKDTPKPNKRALVGTFWFTDKKAKRGRWVFFWVTEETEGYRIAKFNQYLQ